MKTALIVDDVTNNRYLLRALLEGYGYTVDEAPNGMVALARARQSAPTLVISDLLMPQMDGYTLLREWKSDPKLNAIPFLVYTATYTEPSDARLALDLGADAFILKPAEPSAFMAQLEAAVARAELGPLMPANTPDVSDPTLVTRHNDALVRKLAQKAAALELANHALQLDIVRRERAEARAHALLSELQSKSGQLEQALSMARMGVWLWDLGSDRFTVLEGQGPLMALPDAERPTTGGGFLALVHPDDRDRVQAAVAHAKQGHECDAEFRLLEGDGEPRWVAVHGRCPKDIVAPCDSEVPCDSEGSREGKVPMVLTGLDQDVTDQKRLEERLRNVQKMEAIGQLAGGVAHDFNNILAAIICNAELIHAEVSHAESVLVSADEILHAARRGTDLTQRILTFSRPHVEELRPTNLSEVLEEAVSLLRSTLPASIALTLDVTDEIPPVLADASQIHQIALNLITNARHAMTQEAGRIEARLESCRVDTTLCSVHPELQPGPYVRLTVRDNGSGMDPTTLEHMFEPFFTTKAAGEGAGLGLSVVHGIVRAHKGCIFADSQPGHGTVFCIFLPACAEGTSMPHTQRYATLEPIHGHGLRVLYVDDEASLVSVATRFLQSSGFEVDGFTRARDALTAFRSAADSYDIVIMDYNMPEMTGIDLARELLSIRPTTRILLTTGYMRPDEVKCARDLGISELVTKPYLIEELGPRLGKLLAESSQVV